MSVLLAKTQMFLNSLSVPPLGRVTVPAAETTAVIKPSVAFSADAEKIFPASQTVVKSTVSAWSAVAGVTILNKLRLPKAASTVTVQFAIAIAAILC